MKASIEMYLENKEAVEEFIKKLREIQDHEIFESLRELSGSLDYGDDGWEDVKIKEDKTLALGLEGRFEVKDCLEEFKKWDRNNSVVEMSLCWLEEPEPLVKLVNKKDEESAFEPWRFAEVLNVIKDDWKNWRIYSGEDYPLKATDGVTTITLAPWFS